MAMILGAEWCRSDEGSQHSDSYMLEGYPGSSLLSTFGAKLFQYQYPIFRSSQPTAYIQTSYLVVPTPQRGVRVAHQR